MAQLTPRGFAAHAWHRCSICGCSASRWRVSLATGGASSASCRRCRRRASSLQDALQQSARSAVGGRGRLTRDALVVLQVAAALVLLAGAGLMLRTLANLRAIDVGFRTDHLLTMRTTLPPTRYRDPAQRLAFYERVTADARALPGVESAAYISMLPFTRPGNTIWFAHRRRRAAEARRADRRAVSRRHAATICQTLGVQLVDGRLIDERDVAGAPLAVVINETLKRRYWPDASPLGTSMRFGDREHARCSPSSASSRTCTSAATSWR